MTTPSVPETSLQRIPTHKNHVLPSNSRQNVSPFKNRSIHSSTQAASSRLNLARLKMSRRPTPAQSSLMLTTIEKQRVNQHNIAHPSLFSKIIIPLIKNGSKVKSITTTQIVDKDFSQTSTYFLTKANIARFWTLTFSQTIPHNTTSMTNANYKLSEHPCSII